MSFPRFLSEADKKNLCENPDWLNLSIQLAFTITTFDVTKETFRFDVMSFIAEVGGFLGLLLGASGYSAYLAVFSGFGWIGRSVGKKKLLEVKMI